MARALIVEILGNATQFGKELDRAAGKTRQMGKVAGVAGLAIAGGLAFGLEKSVVAATHFQSSMELVHTQAGVSQKAVDSLGHSVLGLAGNVGTAPDELSAGLYHLASQGLRGKQALDALRIAAEGAKVGQANLEDVTNALGGVLVSGIQGAGNFSHAMGVLNATVGAGDMRMQDLADAMGTGLPAAAATAHVSLGQIAGALATFGDNNIRGAKAGTLLISTMRVLGHQSNAGAKALQVLGVNSDVLQKKLAHGGLTTAIEYLKNRIDASGKSTQLTSSMLSEAFGGKQSTGIKVLIQELDRLKGKVKDVGAGGQRFGSDWQAYSKTSAAATDRLKASLSAIEIELGSALLPAVSSVTAKLAVFTGFLAQNATVAKLAVVGVALLGAALLSFSVYIRASTTGTALNMLVTKSWAAVTKLAAAGQWLLNAALAANPIGLVIIGLVALGAALFVAWKKSETFRDIVKGTWDAVKGAAQSVVNWFTVSVPGAFQQVLSWVRTNWPRIAVIVSGPFAPLVALATNAFGVRSALEGAFDHMKAKAGQIVGGIVDFFSGLPGKIGGAIAGGAGTLWKDFLQLFSKLPGWAKDALGIHSPSTVFSEIGTHIVGGLIHGMEKKASDLRAAAERILRKYVVNPVIDGGKLVYDGVTDIGRKIAGLASSIWGGISGLGGKIGGAFSGGADSGGLVQQVLNALGYARGHGWAGSVTSGYRTYAQQAQLYQRYLRGGPIAAKPGTSSHETGQAVDVTQYGAFGAAMARAPRASKLYSRVVGDPVHFSVSGYAKGGIFTSPTLGVIGEAGPEAVIPLRRGGGMGGSPISVTVNGWVGNDQALARKIRDELVRIGRVEPNVLGGYA